MWMQNYSLHIAHLTGAKWPPSCTPTLQYLCEEGITVQKRHQQSVRGALSVAVKASCWLHGLHIVDAAGTLVHIILFSSHIGTLCCTCISSYKFWLSDIVRAALKAWTQYKPRLKSQNACGILVQHQSLPAVVVIVWCTRAVWAYTIWHSNSSM